MIMIINARLVSFCFKFHMVMCRFGLWTYSSDMVDIVEKEPGHFLDMTEYITACPSVVQSHQSIRHVKFYKCCPEPYADITLNLQLTRRQ